MRFCVGIHRLVALALCGSSLLAPAIPAEPREDSGAEPFTKYERYSATYEVNVDGTYVEHYEWAMRVLAEQGVGTANSTSISYTERLHDVEILQAYTLKPDGRRIDVAPNDYQVSQAGTNRGGADPTCPDHKSVTVVFPQVAVGDRVVFSYRRAQKVALFPGHFSLALPLSTDELYDDVRIRLTAPESMVLRVFSRDVHGGEIEHAQGRREWLWTFRNAKRAEPDYSGRSWLDTGPLILVSTFADYQALGTAYELRARPKAAVTERVRALADELTKDADTPRTQVKAFYDWVSKNIRFAGSCMGAGSVVPHDVDRILTSKMGDCKDHAVLMQALMDAKNIPSTSALVRIGTSSTLPELPVAAAVNHVMNYVPSLDLFVDATSKNIPFGALPRSTSNKPVVLTGAPYGIGKTPSVDDRTNWVRVKTKLQVSPDGSADGESKVEAGG
jgi:transglutaminase-like putative cysteine protease